MKLTLYAFCGMSIPMERGLEKKEVHRAAQEVIQRRRKTGHRVRRIAPLRDEVMRWEVSEPDDSIMVPDTAGLLIIEHEASDPMACGHPRSSYDPRELGCRECDAADAEAFAAEMAEESGDE